MVIALPNKATGGEIWKCLLCNYKRSKYEWQQVLNHANSKHSDYQNSSITNRLNRGMHVEKENDITINMEIDYGRIRLQFNSDAYNPDRLIRVLVCTKCEYENETKGGIKVHLTKKHNEIHYHYNVNCPFCPKTFVDLGTLNRHIYKKLSCVYIKENLHHIHWPTIWTEIIKANRIIPI